MISGRQVGECTGRQAGKQEPAAAVLGWQPAWQGLAGLMAGLLHR